MDRAYSLLKRSIVPAEVIAYRDNLSKQIICYVCGEPVFKKEMWVQSRENNTHFLSHYAGDKTSCKERVKQGSYVLSERERVTQLQKLNEFHSIFREQILEAVKKITSNVFFKKNKSNFEFSERIAKQNLKIGSLEKLQKTTYEFIDQKLAEKIGKEFIKLDAALEPVNRYLTSQFGGQNLKFLTCVSVILAYQKNTMPIEDMLKSVNLKGESNFYEKQYAYIKIILSAYINWNHSVEKIYSYLKNPRPLVEVEKLKPIKKIDHISNKEASKVCMSCERLTYTINSKCPFCNGRLKIETSEEKKIRLSKLPKDLKKLAPKQLTQARSQRTNPEEAKLCSACGKYSYTASSACPKCFRAYKIDTTTSSRTVTKPNLTLKKSNKLNPSIAEPLRQSCPICRNYYYSSTPYSCPTCYKPSARVRSLRFCPIHNETYNLEDQSDCSGCKKARNPNNKSSKSWLASQPWDEENLKSHKNKFNKT